MDKVYIVMMKCEEFDRIASIFSTREKAEQYMEVQSHYDYGVEFYIDCWRVN